ncbi:HNH endonuclease [Acinetobacter haemolyticus]|uniref:HNH endonuclease n=1 Tax=Acinetobacter haemolyticus TaxID=29430 RepID=UPI0021CD18FA|nr:HNH endonuclease signature motif containing protein [Acinetobacter haemolyticus]MCU4377290.1 HNH endonuclease [Acinetobacter haemolyticus]
MLLTYNLVSLPANGIWNKEQTILALFLYYQLPFGRLHARNPLIINWAGIINRNANSLAMKLVNFASLDPVIIASGRKGMGNTSSLDREIWEFYNNRLDLLNTEAELILKKIVGADIKSLDNLFSQLEPVESNKSFYGEERQVTISQRIRQNFFRSTILSNFDERCCISGMSESRLLVASHIVSWAQAPDKRLSPHNGLCLSALYDRAFDRHLLTLNSQLEVMLSPRLRRVSETTRFNVGLLEIEGHPITPPIRFGIDMDLLKQHYDQFIALQK